jgi:hypothetical protein
MMQATLGRMLTAAADDSRCVDVTARKVHQVSVIGLALVALLVGGPVGALLAALDGVVMAVGRFWEPADIFRVFVIRVAEPRGWLRPRSRPEDLETRRVARVMGGVALLAIGGLLLADARLAALLVAAPLLAMIATDAMLNVCAMCLVRYRARMVRFALTGQ